MAPFFDEATRRRVRMAKVPGIDNPPFCREIGRVVLDFTGMTTITFGDTVVVNRRFVEGPAPVGDLVERALGPATG
ncbi:MAG: hypothetical protein Q8W51_09710 [Candidatus Palauibacterales bacterium]|nr:hypothetical protein [Candidatus Palauibacterales bacterium]MDP2530005.1 hypothetical protein [Candidatus Palauibacterales bacterium]MDP2585028.1 hypothetical protein [Candidatus Palauibacterales bacterium]